MTSSKIEGISFLFADVDFVNLHDGITGKKLRPCDCSYGAQRCSEERERQEWTDVELKELISVLHSKGIKVTFSFFNMFYYVDDENQLVLGEFSSVTHPELRDLNKKGEKDFHIDVLKRFSNGQYYEDFLFEQINRIIADYGFDGVHLPDGVSSSRCSVQNGDFSDDMIGQFLSYKPECLLPEITKTKEEYVARRKKIITEYYYDYLSFLSDRWAAFYEKLYKRVNGFVLFHHAWTCNPFEAFYRYGIDYGKIYSEKSYGMMLMDVSSNLPIDSKRDIGGYESTEEDCVGYHYKFMLMQMHIKAYLPHTNLVAQSSVKDTTEQWDMLRHNPMELSKNIIRRGNTFVYRDGYQPCVSAPVFCLSNGIPKSDWNWLHKQIEDAKRSPVEAVCGYTALFSRKGMDAEVKQYIQDRSYSSFELQYQLLLNGLDLGCVADVSQVESLKTLVLVTNYHLLPLDEQEKIMTSKAPMVIMSETPVAADGFCFDAHYCFVLRNLQPYTEIENDIKKLQEYCILTKAQNEEDDMGGQWACPLRYSSLPKQYFILLSELLSKVAKISISPTGVHVTRQKIGENRYRYFLSNDTHRYLLSEIQCGGEVKSAVSVLKYKGYQVRKNGTSFVDRIPPRGMCIVETEEL